MKISPAKECIAAHDNLENYPMKSLRGLGIFVIFASFLFKTASANLWRGTINESVTITNDPRFPTGTSIIGCYQYDSETADGVFFQDSGQLEGQIFLFNPLAADEGWQEITEGYWRVPTKLTVTGGVVTDFIEVSSIGSLIMNMSFHDFGVNFVDLSNVPQGETGGAFSIKGTLSFSTPVAVPEETSTGALLGLILIVLILPNRRRLTHC